MKSEEILWKSYNEKAILCYVKEEDLWKLTIMLGTTEISVYLCDHEIDYMAGVINDYFTEYKKYDN